MSKNSESQKTEGTFPSVFSLQQQLTLTIDGLASSGDGVARHQGAVVFIPFVIPGEEVLIKITELHKNFARGRLLKILKQSPHRVEAPCPVFSKCGGCQWQHMDYPTQLKAKQEIVRSEFEKQLKLKINPEIQESPKQYSYRNRVSLKVENDQLGYFALKSHDFVSIKDCHLAEEPLRELIRSGNVKSFLKKQKETPSFSQVNSLQNEKLIQYVLQQIPQLSKDSHVLDLYAGSGNFAFPIFEKHPQIQLHAVELGSESVAEAKKKLLSSNISSKIFHFYAADVQDFLWRWTNSTELVVLDPPRAGCSDQVIQSLVSLKPERLIYISCNPATLARDLKPFIKDQAYTLESVQLFDMFPQTSHIESVATLRRN